MQGCHECGRFWVHYQNLCFTTGVSLWSLGAYVESSSEWITGNI